MTNKLTALLGHFLTAGALLAAALPSAMAAPTAYLSSVSEPWNDFSNVDAMNAAFGASNWDRLQYGDSFTGYDLLYIDGGSDNAADMVSFLSSNQGSLETYVLGGGRLFINAATEWQTTFDLVFGATSTEQGIDQRSYSAFAVNAANPLFTGAGTSWDGYFFAHNEISTSGGFSDLMVDELGRTLLTGGFFGSGYVMLGSQTNTAFHAPVAGSDPFQLRVNELLYALGVQAPAPNTVPEPHTYSLVLAGLGLTFFLRRKKPAPV